MKTHATHTSTTPEQAPATNGTAQFNDQRPVTQRVTQLQDSANTHTIQRKANKTGLPDNLKSGIENLSGYAMDDVKVHYNSSRPAQLQAHAYAQGTDIHVAPGQERHLPHEAWHVVQQKQGRVKPIMQLKGKVNVNDDASLEREADVMGSKALQMKPIKRVTLLSQSNLKPIAQLKNLTQAGLHGAMAMTNANTPIFDSPRMLQGQEYSQTIPAAANNYSEVINAYTSQIRPLGNKLSAKKYTDEKFSKLPDVPAQNKLSANRKQEIIDDLENKGIICNRGPFNTYETLSNTVRTFKSRNGNRNVYRNNTDFATIDPFVVKMTLNPPHAANPWEIHTQFADSGTGYIKKIKRGDTNTSASIETKGTFNKNKNNVTANQDDYSYSSTHDQGKSTFESKIKSMGPHAVGDKRGKFHGGFDAITWMGAEGARFRPVKALGEKASPQSKFFVFPDIKNLDIIKAVDLTWLMQNWGQEFKSKYNIKSKEIARIARTKDSSPFPSKGYMYNLTTGRVINAQAFNKWKAKNNWQKLLSLNYISQKQANIIKSNVIAKKAARKANFLAGRQGHQH